MLEAGVIEQGMGITPHPNHATIMTAYEGI